MSKSMSGVCRSIVATVSVKEGLLCPAFYVFIVRMVNSMLGVASLPGSGCIGPQWGMGGETFLGGWGAGVLLRPYVLRCVCEGCRWGCSGAVMWDGGGRRPPSR